MSSNENLTRINMVDKQVKLHQLSMKGRKAYTQRTRKFNRLRLVTKEHNIIQEERKAA
ncbi:hypothetical protein [Pleurocapsa sp. PCC 7319]|uniref:hypothetical protein n=1 Tax=Pleurocapsa sp. PCC 7319 TaxID=118161 RepID=UPI00035F6324|nr:hypothetical protein [Pleurocapsa sp. PCC 7319]